MEVVQIPAPGKHQLFFKGNIIEFKVTVPAVAAGKAFVRTNLENAAVHRHEIINRVEADMPNSGQEWHDLRMVSDAPGSFSLQVALLEVGHFEAKCYFLPDETNEPVWPAGNNIGINVEPAEYCCANSIYCAFVRQFGKDKKKRFSKHDISLTAGEIKKLDENGYTLIPPSGTFRDLKKELDFIIDKLNCRIIHLLPINPVPTVYGRMGRYGSPYASLDFTAVDPALAEFDKKATPLDQFLELAGGIHQRNGKVIIDIAINHTGWAAKLHEEHPDWLVRDEDGNIVSPGAWGVTWGDLTELDHQKKELWKYLADVFLTWCSREVDGFRCDAGYMIPFEAWEYIIAKVREEYPNTLFLLEGLGGDPAVTRLLLNKANMNWAYSELFQNCDRKVIEGYIRYANEVSLADGLMVHYAETHDNNRLAATSQTYARMRTGLCALLSMNGTFGFTNGVEWFAEEKIDVHRANALNWGSRSNQVAFISRLNTILIAHPAFMNKGTVQFVDSSAEKALCFLRCEQNGTKAALVIINLDCENKTKIGFAGADLPFELDKGYDLITGKPLQEIKSVTFEPANPARVSLTPGTVLCLSSDSDDVSLIQETEDKDIVRPDHIDLQRAKVWSRKVVCWKNRSSVVSGLDIDRLEYALIDDPVMMIRSLFAENEPVPLVVWRWPQDVNREVMIPPRHLLIITAPQRFSAYIVGPDNKIVNSLNSLKSDKGYHFILFARIPVPADRHQRLQLRLVVYCEKETIRKEGHLLLLTADRKRIETRVDRQQTLRHAYTFLEGNSRGGMLRPCVSWSELNSRYDAFLAANLDRNHPEDRHIMWRRCRVWLLFHGRSIEMKLDNVESFFLNEQGGGSWEFHVPIGNGLFVDVSLSLYMVEGENAVFLDMIRKPAVKTRYLDDRRPVRLIVRPDIEDRNFHYETKAGMGPEKIWPHAVQSSNHGFTFSPDEDRSLSMTVSRGKFKYAPEWVYAIYHSKEADRGLDPYSDLFSPGYFSVSLVGGTQSTLLGQVVTSEDEQKVTFREKTDLASILAPAEPDFEALMVKGIREFVVKRDELKTVIAGYPWFLDWGRDTLICCRGMLAAGMTEEVKSILLQFAKFAENGTLPNMIHGNDASNRDTSDAPLWFFVVCRDLCRLKDERDFLQTVVEGKGGKSLLKVLESLAEGYVQGTPNGIQMDPDSGLIYSPPHFTWMDTNYPAATPREGYPIEIQALWYAAVSFLEEQGLDKWRAIAQRVRESALKYFVRGDGWLADCLHCRSGVPAKNAVADDHLRPNQLFALTLGLIDDLGLARTMLDACSELLIPGAVRSLADRSVDVPLKVIGNGGGLLNEPGKPYWGQYLGDEDTRRKPAYHNGTAWTWPFPSYAEAYCMLYGSQGKRAAKAILSSSQLLLEDGCIGQIPEILDGDFPHQERGCDAQAWGITELYRVWKIIHRE